jgi:hypothetical protein
VELPSKVATADDPDVLTLCSLGHLCMHSLDMALNKANVGALDRRQVPVRNDPAWLRVGPGQLHGVWRIARVPQHPLVGR